MTKQLVSVIRLHIKQNTVQFLSLLATCPNVLMFSFVCISFPVGHTPGIHNWHNWHHQRSAGLNAPSKSTIEMKNRDHFVALDEAEAALGNALEATLEVAGLERKRGMILPFQPLSISFDDLKYYVDMPAVCLSSSLNSPQIAAYPTSSWSVYFIS